MHESESASTRVVEEAFLSPRVVDAATLSEFAESMRGLLRGAASQHEQLREAMAAGETVAQTLTETASKASRKLRPAVKLIPTIDQKLAQAEEALSRAIEAARLAERATGKKAKAATKEETVALRQTQDALDTALERARELEGRLRQLTQRAELAVEALDKECKQRLENAARHAQDVLGTMVAELDTRAEEVIHRSTRLIEIGPKPSPNASREEVTGEGGTLTGATAAAADACADIEKLVESFKSRTTTLGDKLDRRVNNATRRAKAAAERVVETDRLAAVAESRLETAHEQLLQIEERGRARREITSRASEALAAFDEELAARMLAAKEMLAQKASVADGNSVDAHKPETSAAPESPPPSDTTTEVKPSGEPTGLVRIDRPVGVDAPRGLPGPLRF